MPKHETIHVDDLFRKPKKAGGKIRVAGGMSKLEMAFSNAWRLLDERNEYPLTREVVFHPERLWRLDFAFLEAKVGIEVQGGTFKNGAHSRGKGQNNDFEKASEAMRLGWVIFQVDCVMLRRKNIVKSVTRIMDYLRERSGK